MNDSFDTPVLFLIFNRPDTTQRVFEKIRKIKPKYFYIAADGPREKKEGEQLKCKLARDIVKQIDWDCEVKYLFQEINLGCSKAVSTAISWFFENVEEGIILEDDCLPNLTFFPFCQELLQKYRNDEQVMLISGTNLQNGVVRGSGSYFFTKYANIWGWASWRRVWGKYDFEMNELEFNFQSGKLDHVFENRNEKKFWFKKFQKTKASIINTWDYQLLYSIWKNKGIAISPNTNLIVNIGLDNSARSKFLRDSKKINPDIDIQFPLVHPPIEVHKDADNYTFFNIYSHNMKRLFRLIRENKFIDILTYIVKN